MIFDFFSGERPLEEEEEGERKPLTSNNRRWVPGAEYDAHHDRANSNPTAVPRYGFLRSIGLWGRRKVKSMPMNPLHDVQTTSSMRRRYASDPDAAHLSRFLLAIEELYGKSRRRGEEVAVQFSEEEKRGIVARYAETRWWGRLYNPVKDVSDSQIRRTLRWGRFVIALCVSAIFGALLLMYRQEMHMVSELSAQDRRDYTRMVMGMRQGDIRKLGNEVLSKEDPLYVLPEAARCHILLEEARKRHWDKVDWEVECRNQHPESALVEGDFIHLLYWAAMLVGNLLYGGSAVFDDAAFRFADASKDKERREPAKPLGPTAKPESVKRTFFS